MRPVGLRARKKGGRIVDALAELRLCNKCYFKQISISELPGIDNQGLGKGLRL